MSCQLPDEHTRVGYLLESIQNNDPGLQAAMANVCSSKGPGGMRSDFELMVAHILPYCPVAKKRTAGSRRGPVDIWEVNADKNEGNISSFGTKSRRGPKTGVLLRYHKHSEYQKLSEDEQSELREWRTSQGNGKSKYSKEKAGKTVRYDEKSIAAVVEKRIDAKLNAMKDTQSQEAEAEAFIASCLQKFANGDLPASKKPNVAAAMSSAKASTTILNSILGQAKNSSKKG